MIPKAYRDLPGAMRALIVACLPLVVLLVVLGATAPQDQAVFWIRTELTLATAVSLTLSAASLRGAGGRVRTVRTWIAAALGFWLVGVLVRNLEVLAGVDAAPAISDIPFAGGLVCAALAYSGALRGRLSRGEELTVYLDGAIVFFATAGLMLTVFGDGSRSTASGSVDLLYAVFFLAAAGATLVLDLAVRVERKPHGALVVLAGMVLLGAGFLMRVAAPQLGGMHAGAPGHLLSIGVILTALGTVTWTDVMDDAPRYVEFAARLRRGMPIVAVGLTSVLIAIHLMTPPSGPVSIASIVAIALVIVLVAIRQSVLLSDRESAIGRERELGRELSSAELKYRTLVERQPAVVYIAEPGPTGQWFFVGPQVEAMLGYGPEEWTADPDLWARLIHPDDRDAVVAQDAAAGKPGSTKRLEYRMVRRDGRVLWVLDESSVIESGDGRPLLQGILLDISAAKGAEDALRASEEQQRMIIETASYAFVAFDGDGRVVEWNRRAEETFGWARAEAFGAELAEMIIPADMRAAHREGMRRYAATGHGRILSRRMELEAVHRDGHQFPVEITIWPVQSDGETRFNALIDDITVRKELEEQLRHQALHDSLTGLANRVLFSDRVQHALDRSTATPDASLAVLFLDLDDFKTINDSLGHGAGDELLIAVGRRLEATLRPGDTAARLGGDEFAVLLEDAAVDTPQAVAAQLLEAFASPFVVQGKQVQVHATIGIAVDTGAGTTPAELLRNADLAMYVAKQRGKSRYETYRQRMHEDAVRRLELKAGLERAIADEQLELYYQPIVELRDGTVLGFEALLRWRDAGGQFVPLSELIPLAEETGLIIAIGRFILREACRQAAEWANAGDPRIRLSVNVSPSQLEHGSVSQDVRAALRLSGLDPSTLVIEITESTLIDNNLSALRELRQLRKLGVHLALDDFGTGYSSLGRLRHLPFDMVKIDRSFVSRITREQEGAVVQSILEMAATLNLEVVAEGIETHSQLLALRARGCLVGQGYYFSAPVPPEAVIPILAVGRLPLPRRRRLVSAERGA